MNEKRGLSKFLFGGALGVLGALFFDPQRDVESLLHLPGTPAPMHE